MITRYLSDKLLIRYLTLIPRVYPCLFFAKGWRLDCGEVAPLLVACGGRAGLCVGHEDAQGSGNFRRQGSGVQGNSAHVM